MVNGVCSTPLKGPEDGALPRPRQREDCVSKVGHRASSCHNHLAFPGHRPPHREIDLRFLTGSALTEAIKGTLSDGACDVAVAFWGRDAPQRLGLKGTHPTRVLCDLYSGACNPTAIRALLKLGVEVRDIPGLHAKVYIGPQSMIVASANASSNGLAEEGGELDLGLEAGMEVLNPAALQEARAWFNSMTCGPIVTSKVLPELDRLWRLRRRQRPLRPQSFVDALLASNEPLIDRGLKFALYDTEEPPEEVVAAYRSSEHFDEATPEPYPYFWEAENWQLSKGDVVLCMEAHSGPVVYEGFWRVKGFVDGKKIVALEKLDAKSEFGFQASDRAKLTKAVRQAVKRGALALNGDLLGPRAFAEALRPL